MVFEGLVGTDDCILSFALLWLYKEFLFCLNFQNTFHFNSKLWSNKNELNLPGGKTGLDSQETKLPTYWNTPFSKICLGMKIGHQIKFTVINVHATLCTPWLLTGITAPPHWAVTCGRLWLVPRPPHSSTATKKVSMLYATLAFPEQELVTLRTTKTIAAAVTPESGLVQQDILTIPTRVETQLDLVGLIMEAKTSKLWATS